MATEIPFGQMREVETEGFGPGWLAPAGDDQPHDLVLFDKKNPPRDQYGWPVYGVIFGSEELVCGSKKRGRNAFCGQTQRMDSGRCKWHGGKSLKGAASPRYKDGSTSKFQKKKVAGHLMERYETLLADEKLHHHRSSIAQIDSLIDELWQHFEDTFEPDLAARALKLWESIEAANAANNRLRTMELFAELGQVLSKANQANTQGDKIVGYLEARRRHADSEIRRKVAESLVFSLEEAHTFYTLLGNAVRKHVSSEEEKRAVLTEISSIAGASRPRS